jgi:uncharacterized protein YbjT (DUF2867 family)
VGSEVLKQLSSTGRKVRAAVHSTNHDSSCDKLKDVELVETDYIRPETLVAAFKGVDKLFYLLLLPLVQLSLHLIWSPKQIRLDLDIS